jgi:hypothetical protein
MEPMAASQIIVMHYCHLAMPDDSRWRSPPPP